MAIILLKTKKRLNQKKIIMILQELCLRLKQNNEDEAHFLLNSIKWNANALNGILDDCFFTTETDQILQFIASSSALSTQDKMRLFKSNRISIHEKVLKKGCSLQTIHSIKSIHPHDECPFPLHAAIQGGNIDVIESLLSIHPLDEKDLHLKTPLHYAAEKTPEILTAVLSHMHESSHVLTLRDAQGNPPLHTAIQKGREANIIILINASLHDKNLLVQSNNNNENIFHCCVNSSLSLPLCLAQWAHSNTSLFIKMMMQKDTQKKTPIDRLPSDEKEPIYELFFDIITQSVRTWSERKRSDVLISYLRKQLPAHNSEALKEILHYCLTTLSLDKIQPSNQASITIKQKATLG